MTSSSREITRDVKNVGIGSDIHWDNVLTAAGYTLG